MDHVAVVGAGVFGVWTAYHLHAAGYRVTLVDAYGPANSRSSSGDHSRILRCGYGSDEIYSRMARRSLALWRACERQLPGAIFHPCGVLWLAAGDDPYTAATQRTLEAAGYPPGVLDAAALQADYPQLSGKGIRTALLERDGGVILARCAVQWLAAHLESRGVRLLRGRAAALPASWSAERLDVGGGEPIEADAFVFACGAWLPELFPSSLEGRIRPTRQVVVYFGAPPGDERFGPARLPAWIDFPAGIYGVPDLEGRGIKVGLDVHGPAIDPDRADRTADSASIATARAWLASRIPALADAPVLETRVCQYENTASGDFLVDRHPDYENVWIAGGGSGHGFKHGPAIGELAARLVAARAAVEEPRFSFSGRTTRVHRQVY